MRKKIGQEVKRNKTQIKGGEKTMKAIIRLFMVAICLAFAGTASAAIQDSKHDFSADSAATTYRVAGEDRMCVFCHTPHNAVEQVPLWNRSSSVSGYSLYTSSATLTSATKNAVIDNTNISYKCLTCHDGTLTIGGGAVRFTSNAMDIDANKVTGLTAVGSAASNGLTDDHPIGFSYDRVLNGTNNDAMFQTIAFVTGAGRGLKFYNSAAGGNQMECATCHDVHGQAAPTTKFLRTNVTGSYLCLTCHIK